MIAQYIGSFITGFGVGVLLLTLVRIMRKSREAKRYAVAALCIPVAMTMGAMLSIAPSANTPLTIIGILLGGWLMRRLDKWGDKNSTPKDTSDKI